MLEYSAAHLAAWGNEKLRRRSLCRDLERVWLARAHVRILGPFDRETGCDLNPHISQATGSTHQSDNKIKVLSDWKGIRFSHECEHVRNMSIFRRTGLIKALLSCHELEAHLNDASWL